MTPPRAVYLLVRRSGGGTETNVRRLCEAVPEWSMIALEDELGWPLRWTHLPRLLRRVRAERPQLIFCYGATVHAIAAFAFPDIPLIGSIRCESDFAGMKGLVKSLLGWRFRDWISNSRMALNGRGRVIYNGVNTPPPEEALLPNLPRPTIGILASGHRKKGHDFMMDLWESIGRPGSLVFAGNLGNELKVRAEARGVVCPGFVSPGPLIRSLDLLVVPSTAEGIPTVLLEAMSRGVATLSTPVGGIPELVTHGETGYVLPRDAWREFLSGLDWREAKRIGEAGRAHVLTNFSFEKMKSEFVAASASVVSAHVRSSSSEGRSRR